jgi:hypothetical protein
MPQPSQPRDTFARSQQPPFPRDTFVRSSPRPSPSPQPPRTISPLPPRDSSNIRIDSVKRGGVIIRRDSTRPPS